DMNSSISLRKPRRSWMLASTSNERDRPSLSLPRVQMVVDVLTAFGWRASRQDPLTTREGATNVLQPAILQNGPVGLWLTRLSDDHGITKLALTTKSVDELLDELFLRVLTRKPTEKERKAYGDYLRAGFDARVLSPSPKPAATQPPDPYVSGSNHLPPDENAIRIRGGEEGRKGAPPTERLDPKWRERLEDVLWAVLNSSEFVFTP